MSAIPTFEATNQRKSYSATECNERTVEFFIGSDERKLCRALIECDEAKQEIVISITNAWIAPLIELACLSMSAYTRGWNKHLPVQWLWRFQSWLKLTPAQRKLKAGMTDLLWEHAAEVVRNSPREYAFEKHLWSEQFPGTPRI